MRAILNHGVWRLERLALVGANLQLYADGAVTNAGNVNLQVTANTGQLTVSPLALRALGITVPVMIGPVPASLILELSTYISNRTLNLEVTGSIANPVSPDQTGKAPDARSDQFFFNLPLTFRLRVIADACHEENRTFSAEFRFGMIE